MCILGNPEFDSQRVCRETNTEYSSGDPETKNSTPEGVSRETSSGWLVMN